MFGRLFKCKCSSCPVTDGSYEHGMRLTGSERVVALAGNPNTGKSTVFNALTGMRQHTGNWPGKTVSRAEGTFFHENVRYKLVDLPGTYSLLSASTDEEIARDFILFGRPDCTVAVLDATCLQRNLNLALQVLEITPKVVVCVNLLDEAKRKGIKVDLDQLSKDLGVPVVGTSARKGEGLDELQAMIASVTDGSITTRPYASPTPGRLKTAVEKLVPMLEAAIPHLPNARWIAYRLIEGDHAVREALHSGTLTETVSGNERTMDNNTLASLPVVQG